MRHIQPCLTHPQLESTHTLLARLAPFDPRSTEPLIPMSVQLSLEPARLSVDDQMNEMVLFQVWTPITMLLSYCSPAVPSAYAVRLRPLF